MGKGRRKNAPEDVKPEQKLYMNEKYIHCTLMKLEDIKEFASCPPGVDCNEWLATNTVGLFNHLNLIYGAICGYCTTTACPNMSAGSLIYLWYDDKGKKTKLPAPQYIDMVMTMVQKQVFDESVFPTKYGQIFPSTFITSVRKIVKLLFHVLAHMYYSHFQDLLNLELVQHLNTILVHFLYFINFDQSLGLVESKETVVLDDLIQAMNLFENHR